MDIDFEIYRDGVKCLAIAECNLRSKKMGESETQRLRKLIKKSLKYLSESGKDCGLNLIFCKQACSVDYFRGRRKFQEYIRKNKHGVFIVNFTEKSTICLNNEPIEQYNCVTIIVPIFTPLFPEVESLVLEKKMKKASPIG